MTVGVDAHADIHVAVALDQRGRRLGAIEIPTTTAGTPKSQDGPVEQIRVLRVAKRSARKNRTMAANPMRALVTTAPQQLRDEHAMVSHHSETLRKFTDQHGSK